MSHKSVQRFCDNDMHKIKDLERFCFSSNRENALCCCFFTHSGRKTAAHFSWKCSKAQEAHLKDRDALWVFAEAKKSRRAETAGG